MFFLYKGHSIRTIPWRIPNSNKWRAKVIVQWNEGLNLRTQHFDSPVAGFGSEEKADLWAIGCGRKWSDNGTADIELGHIQEPLLSRYDLVELVTAIGIYS